MNQKVGKSARALRAAGYIKIPAWWATQEQIDMIEWMVRKNLPEIARIKAEAHGIDEIDAAWQQHEETKK